MFSMLCFSVKANVGACKLEEREADEIAMDKAIELFRQLGYIFRIKEEKTKQKIYNALLIHQAVPEPENPLCASFNTTTAQNYHGDYRYLGVEISRTILYGLLLTGKRHVKKMDESLASMTEIELSELEKEGRALYAQIVETNALIQSIFFVTMIPGNALKTSCIAAASAIALQQDLSMLVTGGVGYFVACGPRSWFNYRFISKFGSALPNSSYVAKASAAPGIGPVVPGAAMAPLAAKNKLEEPVKKLMEKYLSYLPTIDYKQFNGTECVLTGTNSLGIRNIAWKITTPEKLEGITRRGFVAYLSHFFSGDAIKRKRDALEIAVWRTKAGKIKSIDLSFGPEREEREENRSHQKTWLSSTWKKQAAEIVTSEMLYQKRMKKQVRKLCEKILQILSPVG